MELHRQILSILTGKGAMKVCKQIEAYEAFKNQYEVAHKVVLSELPIPTQQAIWELFLEMTTTKGDMLVVVVKTHKGNVVTDITFDHDKIMRMKIHE